MCDDKFFPSCNGWGCRGCSLFFRVDIICYIRENVCQNLSLPQPLLIVEFILPVCLRKRQKSLAINYVEYRLRMALL